MFGHINEINNLQFYKVSFTNLNTVSMNEYFGRDIDPIETVFLSVAGNETQRPTESDFEGLLNRFLWDTCYCDEIEYETAEKVDEETNSKLIGIVYEVRETISDFHGEMPDEINSDIIYRVNSIYHC